MLINARGSTASYVNVGNYEFLRVSGVAGDTVNFAAPKQKYYGQNLSDDTNIGSGTTQHHIILQRVPNYNNVIVSGTLTASAWNGNKYGILAFRVAGMLSGAGTISAGITILRLELWAMLSADVAAAFCSLAGRRSTSWGC
jgi:hypothetical protein